MDPLSEFKKERASTLKEYAQDTKFQDTSAAWRAQSMDKRYVYNFDWLGRPIIQYPQDIQAIQEIVWETKPDLIIETGIAHGGSLILSASMLALLDVTESLETKSTYNPTASKRRVIGIDIDIREHNRSKIESHPMSNWITMIEGSSTDDAVVNQVNEIAKGYSRVMVCLDSMHTHDHVMSELSAYAPMVTNECYCIVFDTFVEDVEKGFFVDRPWDVGNNPKTAVHEWIKSNPNFMIDREIQDKLMITVAPDGFLKRTS